MWQSWDLNPDSLGSEFMLLTFSGICCCSKHGQLEILAPPHSPLPHLFSASAFYTFDSVTSVSAYSYAVLSSSLQGKHLMRFSLRAAEQASHVAISVLQKEHSD